MKHQLLTSASMIALICQAPAQQNNLIENGDFSSSSLKPWKLFGIKKAAKPEKKIHDGTLTISVKVPSVTIAHRQLTQSPIAVDSNKKYKLSFEVKSMKQTEEMQVTLTRSNNHDESHYGLRRKVLVSNSWENHTLYFTTTNIDANDPATFKFLIGKIRKSISFRNVSLTPVKPKQN